MTTIKIAGVPEHFNLPWHLAIEKGDFNANEINLQWTDIPEGTGKLCQMLRIGETDIAVILTEGIIKDIAAGNASKIVQIYVESPLIWGIHVAAKSNYYELSDLENKKVAISRLGSGSQLMAFVNANNQGWKCDSLTFETVNTIDGAVVALTNGTADYFMWERFMTKPLVDSGVFRKIVDCPTPWPCFVIAVRDEILNKHPKIVSKILEIINSKTATFKKILSIDAVLAAKYYQKIEDIQEWLQLTTWSQSNLSEAQFETIQNQLFDLEITDKKIAFRKAISEI